MDARQVETYLSTLFKEPVKVDNLELLGEPRGGADAKGYGYGAPVRVHYRTPRGESRSAVIHTIGAAPFGHEHMADRAQILLWQYRAFNSLPRHIRALDAGGFDASGALTSVGRIDEFCLLTEYATGNAYAGDLERICRDGIASPLDFERADALCDYLADIHREPVDQPGLYVRRMRELVGHGECIMGLTDSYPPHPSIGRETLEEIEHRAVAWRWRLKDRVHRLRQVHGDFHPWNILFRDGTDFGLLDRSRGEYGDPADDVTCLTANYIFFSLQRSGRLEGSFNDLLLRFWDRYLAKTGDREMLDVAAPFFAFRGLVMASPLWYPDLPETVRRKLIAFVLTVLDRPTFDPREVNAYCGC